jgi:OmpA-OmpF porin, OOP family
VKDIKFIIFIFILISFGSVSQAQLTGIDEYTPKQLLKFARNCERSGDIYTAIVLYEKYYARRSNNNDVNYKLAELNRQARNYEAAKDLYNQVAEHAEDKYPLARFYYAQMLKSTGKYDQAIEQFNKFKKDYQGAKDAQTLTKMAKNEISGCDSAKIIKQNSLNVAINPLNSTINGPHIEASPIPVDDKTFIYSSLKIDSLVYFDRNNIDSLMPVRQFYRAWKEGMDWIGGELLPGSFNVPGVETSNGVFSRDGKRFYFTRCQKNWQGKVICSIYRSQKSKGIWNEPVKLPVLINDPNYTSTQPALGRTAQSDREILYFVSDRPDGKGGLDIWYTVWNEEKDIYSKIRNSGSKVNTSGDEMTPYYNFTNRRLYYSSTGLAGIGGLDIFSAFGERNKWSDVKNIGYPLNSSYDDLYFTVNQKQEDGFLVSNRPFSATDETCCDNILYYHWNNFIRITVTGVIYPFEADRFGRKKDLSNFDFMNPDKSIKPLDKAKVALYIQDKESKEYIFLDRFTTAEDGRFYFTLVPDQEYEFRMEGFQYFDSKDYLSTQFFDFSDTLEMPPTWVNVFSDKPIVLENIYYEFNSAELTQKDKNVLDTTLLIMLKGAPEFIIEISAHTDSIGQSQYNLELSQQRADNVVKYLVSRGIPTQRLVAKGYGALKPVAPNYNPDGSDNPVGREKNRRTEFRVIGNLNTSGDEDEEYEGN